MLSHRSAHYWLWFLLFGVVSALVAWSSSQQLNAEAVWLTITGLLGVLLGSRRLRGPLGRPYDLVIGLLFTGVGLLGILAGLTEIIPFLGPWISGGVAVLVALAVGGPIKALEVFILFEVIQLLEGNTVVPLVMSRTVRINPLAVIVAVLIGGSLLGVPGAVLGVPIAGAIQVVIQAVLAPLARRAVSAPPDQTSAPPLVGVVAPTAPAFQEPR